LAAISTDRDDITAIVDLRRYADPQVGYRIATVPPGATSRGRVAGDGWSSATNDDGTTGAAFTADSLCVPTSLPTHAMRISSAAAAARA
jgi:hypothetical protein